MTARQVATLLAGLLTLGLSVAGCGSATTSPSPTATPMASAAAVTSSPTSAVTTTPSAPSGTGGLTRPPVISCALMLDPPPPPPAGTKAVPGTLPASLPIDLVPAGAAIYALTFPQSWTWTPDALYTVGVPGGSCSGWVSAAGGSLGMQVFDAHGSAVVDFVQAGGIGPAQMLACAYLAAARRGAEREFGTLDPSACVASPGDQITEIATGIQDTYLAVVISSTPPPSLNSRMGGTTTSLYSFQKSAEDDRGASWRVTCASGLPAPACYAALAFLAAGTPGVVFAGGTPDVDAAIAAALGVPATPAP